MDQLEIYLLLFTDSLVSNFAFNNSTELAIFSMKIFQELYNTYFVVPIATLASAIAFSANYALGIACYKILTPTNTEEPNPEKSKRIESIRKTKLLPILLILSASPFFGKFIILFAGFCRVPFARTIIIGTLAKFVYYVVSYAIF